MSKNSVLFIAAVQVSLLISACAPESSQKAQLPSCNNEVVAAFDNIDRRTSLYSKKKSRAHLTSILESCSTVQGQLNGSSCLVSEPGFKDAIKVSYENIRLTCEAASQY